jgi:hypothetical protein
LPFTVSVNPAPPAIAVVGESEIAVGTGFEGGGFTDDDEEPQPESASTIRSGISARIALLIPGRVP